MTKPLATRPGMRYPVGATVHADGINFSVFSRHATGVELLLYRDADSEKPFQVIALDPEINRTFFFWHVYVESLKPGTFYTWRVDGPGDTQHTGFRFDARKELVDPWTTAAYDSLRNEKRTKKSTANPDRSIRAIAAEPRFRWDDDTHVHHPVEDSIIYEMHVGGFTRHPSSAVTHPGTFSGVIEKIAYLKDLGITDVELMPVMAFDEQDLPSSAKVRGLRNYWGYSTHSFYSPHPHYCVTPQNGTHRQEFCEMVQTLHKADIGVIMDVAFNHTSEGNELGPTINFKGFANEIFYHLEETDRSLYRDYTGCGNTVNCNHPLVMRFIINCLSYWVRRMHVDGFRFDLASVFARGQDGQPMYDAPLPWLIEFSRTLARTKIIAEAWDACGLYQVGAFPGYRWQEWNGRYRDVMRKFLRGDKGIIADVATCLSGSSDLYQPGGRLPSNSVNFITCHDGFTLRDLVSYEQKHNEENGEGNRDGHNANYSCNYGYEGETDDPGINAIRRRQAKNAMAMLMLSQGVPMILSGDEVLRTQWGNNNAYCQDNETNWFDWRLTQENHEMLRFVREMIALRKRHRSLRRSRFLTGTKSDSKKLPDIAWHGPRRDEPLWHDPDGQILGFTLAGVDPSEGHLHVMLNMSATALKITLPRIPGHHWFRAVDTSLKAPQEILPPQEQPLVRQKEYAVGPRSIVIFEARGG